MTFKPLFIQLISTNIVDFLREWLAISTYFLVIEMLTYLFPTASYVDVSTTATAYTEDPDSY